MLSYGLLLTVLISVVVVVIVLAVPLALLIKMLNSFHNSEVYRMERIVQTFKSQTTDLMNRLQAEDAKTYRILSNSSQSQNPQLQTTNLGSDFVPAHNDASEAAMAAYIGSQGLGEEVYDDVYNEALLDLGPRND